MKTTTWIISAALMAATASSLAAVEADIDGATPGKWTMDVDAAKTVAAEKQLPILLDFSGSDWCGWCKIMEENVFTKPEWKTYAQENLMMVLLDYPRDKSLVPENYVERNKSLKSEYGVTGYPTFVVLDDDGETELGRLRSGRDKTPESFQTELKNLFRFRPTEIEKYAATLSSEDRETYRGFLKQLSKNRRELKLREKEESEAQNQARELKKSIGGVEKEMLEFRVQQLDEDERKQYDALRVQNAKAKTTLQSWLKTKPEENEENMEKYKVLQAEIQEIEKKILQY